MDFETHLGAVARSVEEGERGGRQVRSVKLTRTYATGIKDLWDAVTNPERLPRWFAPVTGELRQGGRYQVQGNAGGTIETCRPPRHFFATWEFAGETSWVELRFAEEGTGETRLTLTHICPVSDHWRKFGPGAVGVGWDLGLLGLAFHLSEPDVRFDEEKLATDPAGRAYILGASEDWGRADVASGEAEDQARLAARRTGAFYTGQPFEES